MRFRKSPGSLLFGESIKIKIALCALFFILAPWVQPHGRVEAAMSRDVRTVLTVGLYGIAAGSLLGALALPATQDVKSIFIGSSVGLYLGLIIGIYHVNHRDDPQNPLNARGGHQSLYSQSAIPIDIKREIKIGYTQTVLEF